MAIPMIDSSPGVLLAAPDETAAGVRQRVRESGRDDWDLVCVVDSDGKLVGTLTPARLVVLDDRATLGSAVHRDSLSITPETSEERMASLALHHGVTALPIVDATGGLTGVVGPGRLMHILRREHVEDLHRLTGISPESVQARQALEGAPSRRMRHRLPWLIAGMLGSAVATFVMARYETALAERPALAFFIPGLVYLADAIGTQSEAIAVRGLSLSHMPLGKLIGGELRTGMLIGLLLALLAFPLIWAAFGDVRLALAVSLALGAASILAAVLGLALPWLMQRLGFDPAYGSGPLATIIQDVLSLLIYFACVTAIVL